MNKIQYRIIVWLLTAAVKMARRTFNPRENLRDAMGDSGMYQALTPRNTQWVN
jgi:hypothetical protein